MLRIRDVMTRDVLTVTPETTLREAAELFASRHVSGAPVVVAAGEQVVGVVSATDLLEFVTSNAELPTGGKDDDDDDGSAPLPAWEFEDGTAPSVYLAKMWSDAGSETAARFSDDATSSPRGDLLSEHTVDEVMTRELRSLAPDLPVAAAAEYMKTAGVHRVVVLEGERLVGIITSSDVTRAVADRRLVEHHYVFDRGI